MNTITVRRPPGPLPALDLLDLRIWANIERLNDLVNPAPEPVTACLGEAAEEDEPLLDELLWAHIDRLNDCASILDR